MSVDDAPGWDIEAKREVFLALEEGERQILAEIARSTGIGEAIDDAQSADELDAAIERAQTVALIVRAAEEGRLPVDRRIAVEIDRARAEHLEAVEDQHGRRERYRAGDDDESCGQGIYETEREYARLIYEMLGDAVDCGSILGRLAEAGDS